MFFLTSQAKDRRSQPVLACDSGKNMAVSEVNTLERVAKDKGDSYCPLSYKGVHLEVVLKQVCW